VTPPGASLSLEGVTHATALGRLLVGDGVANGDGVVIGAACDDPFAIAMAAIGRGRAVLIEPVAACGPNGLREVASAATRAGVTAAPAFRRRLEPELAWARASVASGSIGLPWGVHAEAISAAAPDPLTEALDLLDAVSFASALRPVGVVRLGTSAAAGPTSGSPVVLSIAFDHGGVGQVIARTARSSDTGAHGPEIASFRITGSHGTIHGDLDGPALERHGDAPGGTVQPPGRVDPAGAQRLIDAFTAVARGDGTTDALVGLAAAADLLALVELPTRPGPRGQP
jgi:predicted dehydrogenase